MCVLQKQYDFFKANKSSLLEEHRGKILVISDALEIHAFDTMAEAYTFGARTFGFGNFMIQKCTEDADKVQVITDIKIK